MDSYDDLRLPVLRGGGGGSSSSSSRDPRFGNRFAELGAWIDCFESRERHLRRELAKQLAHVPLHFVTSRVINWQEVPALVGAGSCTVNSTGTGSTFNNLLTVKVTVFRRPATECTSSESSPSCPETCDNSSSSWSNLRGEGPKETKVKSKSKKSKTHKSSKSSSTQQQPRAAQSAPKISADDVSNVYKKLNLQGSRRRSSSSGCEEKKCAKACVPCPRPVFPRLIPYAIGLEFQWTRLRGNLQMCNSNLVHTISSSLINELEGFFRDAGVRFGGRFSGGILRHLPEVSSPQVSGYGNPGPSRGQPMSLMAVLNFRNRTIRLARNSVNNFITSQQQLFGTP